MGVNLGGVVELDRGAAVRPSEGDHSAHGGALPLDERLIRARARATLFGHAAPLRIGKFRIERLVGTGAMGRVFSARDEELGRTVALKIVRHEGLSDSARQRARMLREAQSLAQLSHPNVVGVYEVGPFEDGLYIAMEYVDGQTLRQWLNHRARPWNEIVGKFADAGRGLAAAHRKGIIHRDFKPDNVLLDHDDERPRVADFGLARTGEASDAPRIHDATTSSASDTTRSHAAAALTSRGTRVGTPAYMAPEHLRGASADQASDQYSFCVSLHEALFGHRPEQASDSSGVSQRTPRRIRRALMRGLADEPGDRWADMNTLLAELAPRRVGPGRWWIGATAVAGGIAWWVAPSECERSETSVWDDVRERTQMHFESAQPAYIGASWPAVSGAIERYVSEWNERSASVCNGSPARSDEGQARALDCLQYRHDELSYLVRKLAEGEHALVATAVSAIAQLPNAEICDSAGWRAPADAAEQAARGEARALVRKGREALALSETAKGAAEFSEHLATGATAARDALAMTLAAGLTTTKSDALYTLAHLAMLAGQQQEAEAWMSEAVHAAQLLGDLDANVRALSFLADVVGHDPDRTEEAQQLAAQATTASKGSRTDPQTHARRLGSLGTIAARTSAPQFALAISHHREALSVVERALGPEHPETVRARLHLGETLHSAGQLQGALSNLDLGIAQAKRIWGSGHPFFAAAERPLALTLVALGRDTEALPHLAHVLAVNEGTFGPAYREFTGDLSAYASALQRRGRAAEAAGQLRRGIAMLERRDPEHDTLLAWFTMLGQCELDLSRHEDARRNLERALLLCESGNAPPAFVAEVRVLLARALAPSDPSGARALALRSREYYAGELKEDAARVELDRFLGSLDDWLVSVDSNTYELVRIDTADAATTSICRLPDDGARYSSAAFGPDGTLFVTYKVNATQDASVRLATLDPCNCERKDLARFGVMGASGLAWTHGALYAISHGEDLLLSIDPESGAVATAAELDIDIHNNGATSGSRDGSMYVLDGRAQALFELDTVTRFTRRVGDVSLDLGAVGLEMHPVSGRLFACGDDAILYEIDPGDATVGVIGDIGLAGKCSVLGAPKGPVDCIDR